MSRKNQISGSLHVYCLLLSIIPTDIVHSSELPLSNIILSRSGLAQFKHIGTIDGNAQIDLTVRLDQIDDILKSLVIYDSSGSVGPVSMKGKDATLQLFRNMPFDRESLSSLDRLLNSLVGAKISFETSGKSSSGRIVNVVGENIVLPDGKGTLPRHRVVIDGPNGVSQSVLEDMTLLKFEDESLAKKIEEALAGIETSHEKDLRHVSIDVFGDKKREVSYEYVVSAPIWKVSWRTVIPKQDGKARLQGWAVLENQTGYNWKDIDLTVVSGNAVAFTQSLYESIMVPRRSIPVLVGQSATPNIDQNFAPPPNFQTNALPKQADASRRQQYLGESNAVMAGAAPAGSSQSLMDRNSSNSDSPRQRQMLSGASSDTSATATEENTQISFHFPKKISLDSGDTMMIPLIDKDVDVERSWVYQPGVDSKHPFSSVKISNDGDTTLPTGIVTIFEKGSNGPSMYVGDAILPTIQPKTSKLLPFSIDMKTDIRREDRGEKKIVTATMINGVLSSSVRTQKTIYYEISTPAMEDRTILIEEPRMTGWNIIDKDGTLLKEGKDSTKTIEMTTSLVRKKIVAAKGTKSSDTLVFEKTNKQTLNLIGMPYDQVLFYLQDMDPNASNYTQIISVISAIQDIAKDIASLNKNKDVLENEKANIFNDQDRIRNNLQTTGPSSSIGKTYLETLLTQEKRLNDISSKQNKIDQSIEEKKNMLNDVLSKVKF